MKFLHLSDLHIHRRDDDNRNVSSMLDYVKNHYPEHRLIVTGDITDDGTEDQYENAYALLRPFEGRIFICPGNHDYGVLGNFYSHERAVRFDQMLAKPLKQGGTFKGDSTPVVNVITEGTKKIVLIALDSNLETEHPFDFACGEIGESQRRALNTILAANQSAETVNVLFFHHHPFMVNDPFMELKDARELAGAVFDRVDLILFGHKHQMAEWAKRWGTEYMLASDNSSDKNVAKGITIDGAGISQPKPVKIAP
ncbi:MAG: metallophosphoesterase [Syntrophobacteraceae bacterium]